MNDNDKALTNTNPDYSNNCLKPISNEFIAEDYNTGTLTNLNYLEYKNNINNNIDMNKDDSISNKVNFDKEVQKYENAHNSNKISNDLMIEMNTYNEKIKYSISNTNDILSNNSDTKLKTKNANKQSLLKDYLQGGYKKYPRAKNNRLLIQHYNYWEGNNYFPYGGHIIEGPCSFRPTMASGLAVTLPVGLFIGFNAEYITNQWTIAILIVAGILGLFVLFFLILSSFRDPGIIRRHHYSGFYKFERKSTKIFHLGYLRQYKYCGTCSIMRPIRSSHCFDCNNCVEKCDHHCPWIGNCVGKRNYVFFYFFVVCLSFSLLYIAGFCIAHIWKFLSDSINENNSKTEAKKRKNIVAYSLCDLIMSLYLIIYCILCMAFTLGLLMYHTSLVINNATTKEMLKFVWRNPFGNPFNRNLDYNMTNTLFPVIKKYSLLDILRNGKLSNFERNEIERQRMLQQQFFNNNMNNRFYNNNNNMNNNFYNNNNMNNNINNMNSSLNEKRVVNIDPNQDNDIMEIKNNSTNSTNVYMELDKIVK